MTEPDPRPDPRPEEKRPEPKYGQYAPVAPTEPVAKADPAWPPPEPPAAVAPNRTRDVVVTTVLLLLGVFDVVSSFSTFAQLASALTQVYAQFGIDGTASAAVVGPYGLAINIVRVCVLVVTVVVSLLLVARRRRAFWVPLAGWVLAGLATSILVAVAMLGDPAYLAWLNSQ